MKVSEIFASFQGEANWAGMPSLWVRFFGCNLKCRGFGQKDPTNTATYKKPEFDFDSIKKMEDVTVPTYGCDSVYSWDSKFKNLAPRYTAPQVVERLIELGKDRFNMTPQWRNAVTGTEVQLCFTGGEPMLHQKAMVDIITELTTQGSLPQNMTIETNGTKFLSPAMEKLLLQWRKNTGGGEVNISVSPKLFSVSGEFMRVDFSVLHNYASTGVCGALKFVVNNQCWDELDNHMPDIMSFLNSYPGWVLWAMPSGATLEQQLSKETESVVNEAMRRGFNIATRNHISVYGNAINT